MKEQENITNWVDPDFVAMNESSGNGNFNLEAERGFKKFFEEDWHGPQFDDLREVWDPLINDKDSHGRVLAKTALWSVVNLRKLTMESKN